MAEAYNWAKMSSKASNLPDNQSMTSVDVARLKGLYKSLWMACLGDEGGFEHFFQETLQEKKLDPNTLQPLKDDAGREIKIKVNGKAFMDRLKTEYEARNNGKKLDGKTFHDRVAAYDPKKVNFECKDTGVIDYQMLRAMKMIATQYNHVGISNQDTHIAAGFLMGLGYHLQQGCGQGKSSAVATSSFMVRGEVGAAQKQVFITSSTPELASQSFGDMAAYFDDLGIGAQDATGKSQERVFLMTESGPKVAVRRADGKMLSKNDIFAENGETHKQKNSFDETASCETEAARFVVEDGKVRVAKRNKVITQQETVEVEVPPKSEDEKPQKETKTVTRERLGWEDGSKTFEELNPQQRKQALQAIYGDKENVIISDNATIVKDNMKGAIPPMAEGERHAIMDEGDYVKNDQFHYIQQKGEAYSFIENQMRTSARKTARKVIEALDLANNPDLVEKDVKTQFAQFSDAGIEAVRGFCAAKKIKLTNEMMNFIEEALVVETVFVPKVDYVVEGGKVISQEKASGTAMELPEGIAQALAIKHGLNPPTEHKVYNIQTIMGAYDKIFGPDGQTRASGTHEAETKEGAVNVANLKVAAEPNMDAIEEAKQKGEYGKAINAYFQNTRYRSMLTDQKQVDAAIMDETEAILDAGRPVLIGCVASDDVEVMKDQLRGRYKGKKPQSQESSIVEKWGEGDKAVTVITYTAETSKRYEADYKTLDAKEFEAKYGIKKTDAPKTFDKFVKKQGGKANTIILGTSIIGRGANISIEDDEKIPNNMNDKGGLHVITRGLHPSSVRQMVQFINRSMRGSQNGSSHEFFSYEEIMSVKPQIEAELEESRREIDLINGKRKTTKKDHIRLGQLQDRVREYEKAKGIIDSVITTKTYPAGAKGIVDMLGDDDTTIKVDNDGILIPKRDENGKVIETQAAAVGETLYRGFYAVADERNWDLSEKARAVESTVQNVLESLTKHIAEKIQGNIQVKAQIAKDIIPEFMGRALQVQYKANGHTREEITSQCIREISLIGLICQGKAEAIAKGDKKFDETAYVDDLIKKGYVSQETASRVFTISKSEAKRMRKENTSEVSNAVDQVITATIEHLTSEQLRAAYAEINGPVLDENGNKVYKHIKPSDLLKAIQNGGLTYDQVIKTIGNVQKAMKGIEAQKGVSVEKGNQ